MAGEKIFSTVYAYKNVYNLILILTLHLDMSGKISSIISSSLKFEACKTKVWF